MRIKSFFSSRRQYLEQAEQGGEDAAEKAFQAEVAKEEQELQKQREEIMAMREQELLAREQAGDMSENMLAADIARARLDLQHSPLARVALAVVRVRELLRAVVLLPFTLATAAMGAWRGLFSTQRYENFLMSEGERIWGWRNRTENERWFWEMFVWDRLLFPIIAVAAYEYLAPPHFLWSVVVPLALLTWLTGTAPTPATPEFWLVAYFGFWAKVWPGWAAWLAANLAALG